MTIYTVSGCYLNHRNLPEWITIDDEIISKSKAVSLAKKECKRYIETDVREEIDGTTTGHWFFKKGNKTKSMF